MVYGGRKGSANQAMTFTVVQQGPKDEKWRWVEKLEVTNQLTPRGQFTKWTCNPELRIGDLGPTKTRARDRSPVLLSNRVLARPEPQPRLASLLQWRASNCRCSAVRRVTNHAGLIRVESALTGAAHHNRQTRNGIVDRRSLAVTGPCERIAALRGCRKNGVKQARCCRSGRARICTAHGCQRRREAV